MKRILYNVLMTGLFVSFGLLANAQSRIVKGTVSGEGDIGPLSGVTVQVKGTSIGVITDDDGKFSLAVPQGRDVLLFKSIGFVKQEVSIGSNSNLSITLQEDVMGLEEAVVTALAIKKEVRSLGYSTENVSGEAVAKSGEVNVIQGLAAKTAGVQVVGSGGTPGASSKVLIRGNASFTRSNQPLIVVDGIPIDNSQGNMNGSSASDYPFNSGLSGINSSNRAVDLNPEDIESVTILKGPAATALYGSRAGNGAIIYTTKRYKSGVKATYTTSVEISSVNKLPALQDQYAQGVGGGVPGGTATHIEGNPGPDGLWFTADDVSLGTSASWGPKISDDPNLKSYDNIGEFFQNGITWNNNISFSGGTNKANYRMSVGNTRQTGMIPNTEFKRTSVRITSDLNLSEKLKLGGTANYINSGGTMAQNGSNLSGVMLGLTRTPASYNLLGGNGPDGWNLKSGNQHQYFFVYDNPYWTAYENPNINQVNRVLGNVDVNYSPMSWLNIAYKLGTDYYNERRKQIFAVHSWDPPNPTGQIEEFNQSSREIYSDFIVSLNKRFSSDLAGDLSIGNNFNHRESQQLYLRGRDMGIEGFNNLSNTPDLYAGEVNATVRIASMFFTGNLDWKRTLYLTVSGRNDWASTFSPDNRSNFYPAANASFVFTEMMPKNTPLSKVLSFGKMRLGYAQTGIEPPAYQTQTYYTQRAFTDGFTNGISFPFLGVNGFGTSVTLGNTDLKPERQIGTEFGLDLRLYNGRINVDYTYYNQKSVDILLSKPIAPSSGYRFLYTNAGEMVNKGHEIAINATPVKMENGFQWDIGFNFTKNVNEVLKLEDGVDEINIETAFSSIGSFAIVGDPYGALYGSKWKRTADGQLLISPTTGLPLLDPSRGNVGNPFPDYLMNIRNSFSYKGFELSALLDIREGGDIWCGTCARLNRLGRSEESANREETYVIEGVVADANGESTGVANTMEIPASEYFQGYLGDRGAAVEQAVFDGSWVRLRELTLNYNMDMSGMEKPIFKSLTLYVTGRNLWLSTDYPGVDPETSLTGSGSNVNGFDYFNNPGTKSWIFGLRAGF